MGSARVRAMGRVKAEPFTVIAVLTSPEVTSSDRNALTGIGVGLGVGVGVGQGLELAVPHSVRRCA